MSYKKVILVPVTLISLFACSSLSQAASRYWNATYGNWSTAANWGGTEPASSNHAYIQNGGTAIVNQSGEACRYLFLGETNTGAVEMPDGSLSVNRAYVGNLGTGTFMQSGGMHTISETNYGLYLGYNTDSNGTYTLSGTGQLSASYEYNGYSGTGSFTQTGGINSITSSLFLGYNTGSNGTYTLSGTGQLHASYEAIGQSGTGTFTQSGGTNSITYGLDLGSCAGSNGTYNLSNTGHLSAQNEYIGSYGSGTFTQTGGINSISGNLSLGYFLNCTGTYDLSGTGQLSAKSEQIGELGTGTFTQTSGTNTTDYLSLGTWIGSTGVYNLSGTGQLSATREKIGNSATGTFSQTGGINTSTYTLVGTSGTYALSGGSLNINGGFENQGVWDLRQSETVINAPSSIIKMSGSVLVDEKKATLNLDANSLLIVPSGHYATEYFKSINNAGIIHQAGSVLDISATNKIYGIGSIDDHINCKGILSATPGDYYIDLNNGLNLSGTGNINLGSGRLYVNDDISGMDAGTLVANALTIGNTGTGTFTQSGGIIAITNSRLTTTYYVCLDLGFWSGSSGTYNLSGSGQLSAVCETIGYFGNGTFTQTGGTNSITDALYLGYDTGNGTYNLNGGTLILKSLAKGSGTAVFNFGNGILMASDHFSTTLPMTLTGTGGNAKVDTSSYSVAFSGVLSGEGGLNKLGSGILTLNNLNTYSGDTTVADGTLEIAAGIDAAGTSLIDVQSGKATFKTTSINKTNLNINTAALATFEVINGMHSVGAISGSGITQVDSGAKLTAASISQNILTIGSGAKVTIRPLTGGQMSGTMTVVPEPSSFMLLSGAAFLLASAWAWKRINSY